MKASRYNILVEVAESSELLLYNSLYGGLTHWGEDEVAALKLLLDKPELASDQHAGIYDVLVQQKNLVDDSVDELEIVTSRKLAGMRDPNRLDLILLPTLDCNLACVYCYEKRQPGRMTSETELAIKEWLTRTIPDFKVVTLSWFGGEPLLGYSQLCSITQHAMAVSAASGTSCIPHVTTNGYLLTETKAQELVGLGIRSYQITLDGPRETHDSLRVLRNGGGTFDRILTNIESLARVDERVGITLRVNFNHTNVDRIPDLLEMIPESIRPQLRIVYEPIFGDAQYSAAANLGTEDIAAALSAYYEMATQLGYNVVLGQRTPYPGKLVYCYAERENQLIINHVGDLFKCSVTSFEPTDRVGSLRPDGTLERNEDNWAKWASPDLFEEKCRSCAYLPLCMGGCRKMRNERNSTGSWCNLIPTNTSYLLKEVAFGRMDDVVRARASCNPSR